MPKQWFILTSLALMGCTLASPISHSCSLILKPQITAGTVTKTTVAPYDKAAIQHLTLKLFIGAQDTGISKTIPNAQLNNPVVFSNLKDHTTYRVKAYAYASTDASTLISFDDANSWTDITLTDDDRPAIADLKVKLIDRAFNGQASSSLTINPGGFSPIAIEQIEIPIKGIVSTIAGNGNSTPRTDGVALAATLSSPHGVALDSSGNLYIAEEGGHTIRKLAAGTLSTLAGSATYGTSDGIGTAASFRAPHGVAVDSLGNVYVADTNNHSIRKITPAGAVSTIAGNGSAALQNGTGTQASFYYPVSLALNASGDIFVADWGNNAIRRITTTGVVTTFAGNGVAGFVDGMGTAAKFNIPRYLAFDSQGNLFVSDKLNYCIRKITPSGMVSTFAGNGTSGYAEGQGTLATFAGPEGVAVDAYGYIYVADRDNNRIRRITPNGLVTTLAGNGNLACTDGVGNAASLKNPIGLAIDAYGNIFVGEYGSNRIRRIQ